jgi:putative N6-adenine-specific DNA methylase
MKQHFHYFAPCPRGLESVLVEELTALGARQPEARDGGVAFSGDRDLMYRANLHCRIASRILWRLDQRPYRNEQDLYSFARQIDWPALFDVSRTIKVVVTGVGSPLRSLEFAALKVKDAICDGFRKQTGERPSVDTQTPDVRIHLFLTARDATLYLDTSGEALFKRGYRQQTGEAPLRENLAAGLLRLAGWQADEPLLDPMCGSGTFLVEAALIARNIAPGRDRDFAFERLRGFDAAAWSRHRDAAKAAERPVPLTHLRGRDRDINVLHAARTNLGAAGFDEVMLEVADFLSTPAPGDHGVLICNPPYGIRLDEQETLAALYPEIGHTLKQHYCGWRAYFFTGDLRLAKLIRLSASRRTPLFNGALECRLFEFKMVAGSNRRPKAAEPAG